LTVFYSILWVLLQVGLTALIPDKERRQEIVSRLWEYWSDGVFYAVIDFRGVAM